MFKEHPIDLRRRQLFLDFPVSVSPVQADTSTLFLTKNDIFHIPQTLRSAGLLRH
jgi:hypothetical protein